MKFFSSRWGILLIFDLTGTNCHRRLNEPSSSRAFLQIGPFSKRFLFLTPKLVFVIFNEFFIPYLLLSPSCSYDFYCITFVRTTFYARKARSRGCVGKKINFRKLSTRNPGLWHNVVMFFVSQSFISSPPNLPHALLFSWKTRSALDSFIWRAIYFLLKVHLP